MFRPSVNRRSGPAIALCIPMVREYLSLSPNVEGNVKEAIKRACARGSNNESGSSLSRHRQKVLWAPRQEKTKDQFHILLDILSPHIYWKL